MPLSNAFCQFTSTLSLVNFLNETASIFQEQKPKAATTKDPDHLEKGDLGAGPQQEVCSISSPWLQGPGTSSKPQDVKPVYSHAMTRTGRWGTAVLRRILRLGLCLAGKKASYWLIMPNIGLTTEERTTLLPGSCRTYSNSFFLEDVVRNSKW